MTHYVLVVMELATRCVQTAGITLHLTDAFVSNAPATKDPFDGFLLGKRYPPHNRDTKFTRPLDGPLKGNGGEFVVLPPRSPNLHAYRERFVRCVTDEDRPQMLRRGERSLC